MKMRWFALLGMAALLARSDTGFGSELGAIEGYVKDAETESPIQEAAVTVGAVDRQMTTDARGYFVFSDLPEGTYKVVARRIGYQSTSREVEVQAGTTQKMTFFLGTRAIVLGEIVVIARAEKAHPKAEAVEREIEERRPRDVGEFFREIPGASVVKKGGMALDPVIRGFKYEQLNVIIDGGVRVFGACPNRMDPSTAHVQAEDLEKVELFRGPYTVRFGSALGGIVNAVMTKPEQYGEAGLHARVEMGGESVFGGKRGRVFLFGERERYDFYLSGGAKDYSNYVDGNGMKVQSSFRVNDYSLKAGWNPSHNRRFQVSHRQSFVRDVLYPALPMDADEDDTQIYALDWAFEDVHRAVRRLTGKLYYTGVDHVMSNTLKPTYANVHAVTEPKTQTVGGRAEMIMDLAGDGRLYIGGDYYDLNKDGMRTRDIVAGPMAGKHFDDTVWPDAHFKDFGVFSEFHTSVGSRLRAIVGVRMDRVECTAGHPEASFVEIYGSDLDRSDTHVSGHASLFYRPAEEVEISCVLSRGSRSASITERYLHLLPVGLDRYVYLGNPDLKPEGNVQVDLETKGTCERTSFRVSGFYSRLREYISAHLDTLVASRSPGVLGVKRYHNIRTVEKMGGELSAGMKLSGAVTLSTSVAYVFGRNGVTEEPLPEMPPLEGRVRLRYDDPRGRFWGEASGRFVARQTRISEAFGERETPGFSTFGLRTGASIGSYVSVSLGIENLFDRAYYEHLNRKQKLDMKPIMEPGQNVYVGVRLGF